MATLANALATGPKGERNSWFAELSNGERIPCVREQWRQGDTYHDPKITSALARRKEAEFVEALRQQGRAIVTRYDEKGRRLRRPYGYEGLYEIYDLTLSKDGLRFKFGTLIELYS